MKHLHFDVETAGFYGAYWACAGGSDLSLIHISEPTRPSP